MGLLRESDASGGGYLKAGFLGFAGSGKTYTATMLAIGTRAHFARPGPIAFFDTENGSPFVVAEIAAATGRKPLVVKSRSLDDLKATVHECIDLGVSVLIVDSITHVWKEVCETYLRELNSKRKLMRKPEYEKLEFQHWSAIKSSEMWGGWTDLYLNAPLHVIICGRAGYEYDFIENAQGKRELQKVGVKMRVEGEFGFEPSLLVEMSSEQVMTGDEVRGITHRAFVLKDRTMDAARSLVGKSCDNPDWAFFAPHVEALSPAAHSPVDTSRATSIDIVEGENTDFIMERRARTAILEEVDGALEAAGLSGTGNEAKKVRAELVLAAFGTFSRSKLEQTPPAALAGGFEQLRALIADRRAANKEG